MEDLLDLSEPELINVKGLGEKSLDELYKAMQKYKKIRLERQVFR